MPADELTLRQLNRATLARQLLLARAARIGPVDAVERLGGLQAQEARPPFVALWTRVEHFRREQLDRALQARTIVRATMMRATLHLMSAVDYEALRPALQPVLTAAMESILRRRGAVPVDEVVTAAGRRLARRPLTFNELRPRLAEAFPDADERALGYAVRMRLPLVMVPGEDRWSFPSDPAFTPAAAWIGRPLRGGDPAALVRRHLEAFGPATAADIQAWSGLSGIKDVLERMRDELAVFSFGRRRLFDLPDAPRPDADTPAPPRLLPEFDSLLLAHADRTRVIDDAHRKALVTKNLRVKATFLVDGFVAGSWAVRSSSDTLTLTVSPFAPLAKGAAEELAAEAESLLGFLDEAATPRVEFA